MDQTTKEMVMAKSPIKFVSVERVGEAFELAAKEQRYENRLVGLDDLQHIYFLTCACEENSRLVSKWTTFKSTVSTI